MRRSTNALRRRAEQAIKKMERKQETLIEFETCWGDEIPADWKPGSYYVTDWGTDSFEEEDDKEEEA